MSDLQDKIKEKETQYMELAAQMRRKPGLEVEQRVSEYRSRCKNEKYDLDQIEQELEMYRGVVKEYRQELGEIQNELINERVKWIRQKKKDLKQRQELQEQQQALDELGIDIKL